MDIDWKYSVERVREKLLLSVALNLAKEHINTVFAEATPPVSFYLPL